MRVFSVYISLLISRVRPVHSFFEKEFTLENPLQIFTNLFLTLTKNNKTRPDSSDWVLYLIRQKLFLSALVSLVELIDTTCSIHELNLTGVEWM